MIILFTCISMTAFSLTYFISQGDTQFSWLWLNQALNFIYKMNSSYPTAEHIIETGFYIATSTGTYDESA